MNRLLERLGATAARHPWRVIATWAILAVIVVGVGAAANGAFNNSASIPGSQSARATSRLQRDFPARAGANQQVVFKARTGTLDGPTVQAAITASLQAAGRLHDVGTVTAPGPGSVSADHTTALATLSYTEPASQL